jgi:hypothetical protein
MEGDRRGRGRRLQRRRKERSCAAPCSRAAAVTSSLIGLGELGEELGRQQPVLQARDRLYRLTSVRLCEGPW